MAARASSPGSMSNSTSMTLPSNCVVSAKPAVRKTVSIAWLVVNTDASNRVIPHSRAAAPRCSSRRAPTPRPWCSSATTKAASAESRSASRSYRATPTMASPSVATSATRSRWSTTVKCSTSASVSLGWGEKNR